MAQNHERANWQRPRASDGPPIGTGNSPELHAWFRELDAVDADVTRCAVEITGQHCARARIKLSDKLRHADNWSSFGLYLSLMLWPFLRSEGECDWIRALLGDLCEFSLFNPDGAPETRLAQLLQTLFGRDYFLRVRIESLLPATARPALDLVDAWEELERFRLEMSGY